MRIAMKNTSIQKHGQVSIDRHSTKPGHIWTCVSVQPGTLHPLCHQHLVSHQIFHHTRGTDGVQRTFSHCRFELDSVLRLQSVISFCHKSASPFIYESDSLINVSLIGFQTIRRVLQLGLNGSQQTQHMQIQCDFAEDARSLHFHSHIGSILERTSVHLTNTGRCHRFVGETGEDLIQVPHSEFLLQHLTCFLARERRYGVLQLSQLQCVKFWNNVCSNTQRLSQFNKGRTKLRTQFQRLLRATRLILSKRRVFLILQQFAQHKPIKDQSSVERRSERGQPQNSLHYHPWPLRVKLGSLLRIVGIAPGYIRRIGIIVGRIEKCG
mmetsp:Transcript_9348/g.20242  ORF Transcript_9348/g.20242 Transcript_9348/m.20242 type:complete len:324 (-) Transcript_9348:653-1624(-)